jgi:hypothetical protein
MIEFVVIVESRADAEIATKLAERVLVEKVDWLDHEQFQYLFRWSGLQENTEHSCWKDISNIVESARQSGFHIPRFRGHSRSGAIKADGAASLKILNLIRLLQKNRQIRAVFFIRDLDNQRERREGIEQARSEHIDREPKLEIIIGMAYRMREAWVLNGFIPSAQKEQQTLEKIKITLSFDPCEEAHRLRSTSFQEPERVRNPKVVLEELTSNDRLREQQCWEETSLEILQKRGITTGLTAYLQEIEERLIPIILD